MKFFDSTQLALQVFHLTDVCMYYRVLASSVQFTTVLLAHCVFFVVVFSFSLNSLFLILFL